tara:strand:+ start:755 stop:934 length:180 start_codon:yes stop_codon:yes gene_type:complete
VICIEKFFKKKDRFEEVDKYIANILDKISIDKEVEVIVKIIHLKKNISVLLKIKDTTLH